MWRVCVLLAMSVVLSGCVTHVTPPARVEDPVVIYLADYGTHASLVLPNDDRTLTEWAWGDWQYFALAQTGFTGGIRAIFFSDSSTLGRRSLSTRRDADAIRDHLQARRVVAMRVERQSLRDLKLDLTQRYAANIDGEIWNEDYQQHFVPENLRYHAFNNCNHETARWLRALGADVGWVALTGNFRVRAVPPAARPAVPDPAVIDPEDS